MLYDIEKLGREVTKYRKENNLLEGLMAYKLEMTLSEFILLEEGKYLPIRHKLEKVLNMIGLDESEILKEYILEKGGD